MPRGLGARPELVAVVDGVVALVAARLRVQRRSKVLHLLDVLLFLIGGGRQERREERRGGKQKRVCFQKEKRRGEKRREQGRVVSTLNFMT